MKIEAKELVALLDRLAPVAKAGKMRDATPVLFLHENQFIAQGEDCYMSISLEHDFDNIVIPFDKTYELVSRFGGSKEITLKQDDNKIKIIYNLGRKKSTATIAAIAVDEDSAIDYVDPFIDDRWLPLPGDFIEALKLCKFSLPRESLNPVLTNYGINNNVVITSDDFRITYCRLADSFEMNFVISGNSGDIIISNQFNEYISEDNYFDFRKGEAFLRVNLATIDYPKISEKMFTYNDMFKANVAALVKPLERASIFAEGESELDYMINLHIKTGPKPKLTIFAKNDFGKINETGALKLTNVEKELSINPIYLLQALKNVSEKNIEIGIDEFDRLIFNEGSYSHILATYITVKG